MRTVRARLMLGLLLGALLCTLVASMALYTTADHESMEQTDLQLKQIAEALPTQLLEANMLPTYEKPEEGIVIQVWSPEGRQVYSSLQSRTLPMQRTFGHQSLDFQGKALRVYTQTKGGRLVQVSQPVSARKKLVAHLAVRMLPPLAGLVVALAVLIYFVVGRALGPLERVASALAGRSSNALQPLELGELSADLTPVVAAVNQLLAKIDTAMAQQRAFVADAAHELRSPLTALKLQLQLAERAPSDEQRRAAFTKLNDRLNRASHLVQQLLTLARNEAGQENQPFAPCSLYVLARQAVIDHSDFAESRSIDLGVAGDSVPVLVSGNADGLAVMLSNLVDNALRYTPEGGKVDVFAGLNFGQPVLCVIDNGPGVPAADRERVFDRFYRPDGNSNWGSGLGLSIVKNLAELHAADVSLAHNPSGSGLSVCVRFPVQSQVTHFPDHYANH